MLIVPVYPVSSGGEKVTVTVWLEPAGIAADASETEKTGLSEEMEEILMDLSETFVISKFSVPEEPEGMSMILIVLEERAIFWALPVLRLSC